MAPALYEHYIRPEALECHDNQGHDNMYCACKSISSKTILQYEGNLKINKDHMVYIHVDA